MSFFKQLIQNLHFKSLFIIPLIGFMLSFGSVDAKGQVDSTYIKPFDYDFTISTYLLKDYIFLLQSYDKGDNVRLYPNNPMNLGLGFSINNTFIDISYAYGMQFLRDSEYGKTSAFDIQLHNYGRKYVFDVYVQRYKGFYQKRADRRGATMLFPDIKIRQYGVLGQYIFNNKHFSYKAAFDQDERQLKSAGTWLIGGSVFKSVLRSDSTLMFQNSTLIKKFQIGVNGGYAYNFVINKNFFVSGSLVVGVNFASTSIRTYHRKVDVFPNILARLSVGYNREYWALGLSYITNYLYSALDKGSSIALQSGGVQFTFIRRVSLDKFKKKAKKEVRY